MSNEASRTTPNRKGGQLEAELYRRIIRLLPELPGFADRIVGKVEIFEGAEPQTLIADLKRDFSALIAHLNGRHRQIRAFLRWLLSSNLLKGHIRNQFINIASITKQDASKDPRYSLLLKLIHEVDSNVPFLSIEVALRHADPERTLDPQCRPVRFLREASTSTSETRANAVLSALSATSEALYKPYITTLWRLSYLREGRLPPNTLVFSRLVQESIRRLPEYPDLIEQDSGWLRNAAVHQDVKYLVEKDAIRFSGQNHESREVAVESLKEIVERMYSISSHTITRVAQLYLCRELLLNSGLLETFIECLPIALSESDGAIEAAEQKLLRRMEIIFEPVRAFFEAEARN